MRAPTTRASTASSSRSTLDLPLRLLARDDRRRRRWWWWQRVRHGVVLVLDGQHGIDVRIRVVVGEQRRPQPVVGVETAGWIGAAQIDGRRQRGVVGVAGVVEAVAVA